MEDRELDPVCKLNSADYDDNADLRLCSIVFNSSYFKTKVEYIKPMLNKFYYREKISFRTEEGIRKTLHQSDKYYEILLGCGVRMNTGEEKYFYISRAYNPNQVFVYSYMKNHYGRLKLYLENLSLDVSIVHELYNFGNVEI